MTDAHAGIPARGKPADYGQEIVKRRRRRTLNYCSLQEKTVLDFGCGNGAQTMEFISDGGRILALDIDETDLNALAGQMHAAETPSILPVLYEGGRLPVADGSVDVVLSYEVLEHVPDEEAALAEIRRVLKPGGEMIISVPNKAWIFETHGARLPVLPWNRVPFFSWLPKAIHGKYAKARIYTLSGIVNLLRYHGLEVRATEYITAPMDVIRIGWMQRILRASVFRGDRTSIPFFSTSILVHCVKL
jgi:2-polyprenyl-3-methyl-5-hydroxy-6-metoxy-1,4-benzoquinol methylase